MRIQIVNRQRVVSVPRAAVRRAAHAAAGEDFAGQVIDIVFVDDATIRQVNRQFLGRNRVTDVIAFDYRDRGLSTVPMAEVIVSAERARVEARRRNLPLERELILYVIHGVLHLVGYDDHACQERRLMRARERAVLKALLPIGRKPSRRPHSR